MSNALEQEEHEHQGRTWLCLLCGARICRACLDEHAAEVHDLMLKIEAMLWAISCEQDDLGARVTFERMKYLAHFLLKPEVF